MHHDTHIGFRHVTHHRAEQADAPSQHCAERAEQAEAAGIHKGHELVAVAFFRLNAFGLFFRRAVALDVAALKIKHGFGTAAVQVLAGNEHHHLRRGGGGFLPKAGFGKLLQHGGIGNVVELVKLHIGAAGSQLGKAQALAHGVGINGRVAVVAHRAAAFEGLLQGHDYSFR